MDKKYETIKQIIDETVKKMGFNFESDLEKLDDENICVNIKANNEANFLIGYEGNNLEALQHVARLLVNKKTQETQPFLVDVNDYRKNRINFLKDLSYNIAKKAVSEKAAVTLQPMPAFERRIIHVSLANLDNVSTESIDEGSNRRVVVKANQ